MIASFSSGISICPVVFKVFVELFIIEPRPVTGMLIEPRPVKPREIAPKGSGEQGGPTQADILLEAIVLVARKPQTIATKAAMRTLIARFRREFGLDL